MTNHRRLDPHASPGPHPPRPADRPSRKSSQASRSTAQASSSQSLAMSGPPPATAKKHRDPRDWSGLRLRLRRSSQRLWRAQLVLRKGASPLRVQAGGILRRAMEGRRHIGAVDMMVDSAGGEGRRWKRSDREVSLGRCSGGPEKLVGLRDWSWWLLVRCFWGELVRYLVVLCSDGCDFPFGVSLRFMSSIM